MQPRGSIFAPIGLGCFLVVGVTGFLSLVFFVSALSSVGGAIRECAEGVGRGIAEAFFAGIAAFPISLALALVRALLC